MRFPGGRAKALTFSYDDNIKDNIRLAEIFDEHGLKCTFNINSGLFAEEGTKSRNFTKSEATEFYKKCIENGHEVAVHGQTHPWLESLPLSVATLDVIRDRIALEEQFGCIVRGMAYPQGTFDDELVGCLAACGIAYSRTTAQTEKFSIPTDWLRMPSTCHHYHPKLPQLIEKFLENKKYSPQPKLFYIWGHSYEFTDNDNWYIMEDIAKKLGNNDEVWYATNIEIYEYVENFKRLIFSADGKTVKNPTAQELFFVTDYHLDAKKYSVAPGETIKL